jgi:hypothetical protein
VTPIGLRRVRRPRIRREWMALLILVTLAAAFIVTLWMLEVHPL